MSDRHIVISTDCHASAKPEQFVEYVDPGFREAYHEQLEASAKLIAEYMKEHMPEEGLFSKEGASDFAASAAAVGGLEGEWDSDVRRKALEDDRIVAEVIFPNGSPFMGTMNPEHVLAGARAYNRWIAEFCADLPGRRAGLAQLSLFDIEASVAEIRWAADNGLKGVTMPPNPMGVPIYLDPRYEPIWATCEELGLPVHFHGNPQWADYGNYGVASIAAMTSETAWFSHRPLTFLIWAGVLERHPDLKVVFTEIGGSWVPYSLFTLENIYNFEVFSHVKKAVPRPPSEYWYRQCHAAASFMSHTEAEMRNEIGLNNLMWGSDYPHVEGTWPKSLESMKKAFVGMPEADARQILAGNAARIYGFDLAKLDPIAQKVGPTVEELFAA